MLTVNFMPFPAMETAGLVLRRVTPEDSDRLFRLRTEEAVMQYIERPRPKNKEEILDFIQLNNDLMKTGDGIVWAIVPKGETEMVGYIGFWRLKKEHYRGEVGYALLPEYWGKGMMSEALRAVLQYGFEGIGFHSIEAALNSRNEASARILERNGFLREGHFRESYFWHGKFRDELVYSLLAAEWRAQQTR